MPRPIAAEQTVDPTEVPAPFAIGKRAGSLPSRPLQADVAEPRYLAGTARIEPSYKPVDFRIA